jgi:L-threonylcarbamoyladenylate synthase
MAGWRLNRVVHALRQGAIIAYPSDTIWGLGCDPINPLAVKKLQEIKRRPSTKGLILLGHRVEQFDFCIEKTMIDALYQQAFRHKQKPTTWVVPAARHCPPWLAANKQSIAIRLTDKPLIKSICSLLQRPVISTSANISGRPSARNRLQIQRNFHTSVDFIVEDHEAHSSLSGNQKASRIIDLKTGKILRP